jgi:hypothetical protein
MNERDMALIPTAMRRAITVVDVATALQYAHPDRVRS